VDLWATGQPSGAPSTATVTFGQIGVGTDFTGVVLTVDGVNYNVTELPKDFTWRLALIIPSHIIRRSL
jgi:hypothetical protein